MENPNMMVKMQKKFGKCAYGPKIGPKMAFFVIFDQNSPNLERVQL